MNNLTPKLASELADFAYETRLHEVNKILGLEVSVKPYIDKHFNFDTQQDIINGVSGGALCRALNLESGFVYIGTGKGTYSKDIAITFRGTDNRLRDGITDASISTMTADNQAAAHMGFVRTFDSIKPKLKLAINELIKQGNTGTIHCVGHSLGGALAQLCAVWVKARFSKRACLYTFGAPRVGRKDFAIKSTTAIDEIFRCIHNTDPVPMIPIWPFYHAPYKGKEYVLSNSGGLIEFSAHKMPTKGNPGYINSANTESWNDLKIVSDNYMDSNLVLFYKDRLTSTFNNITFKKLTAALLTLLKATAIGTTVLALSPGAMGLSKFVDILAQTLSKIAKLSSSLYEQVKGFLGHLLCFCGSYAASLQFEITHDFVKQALSTMVKKINQAAALALDSNRI
ncbi:lipase [Marinomonas sp. A3A]|uniref:lipase family protein n=1 Tax=Marinomonas sp. A3A TaxID=2065312 RepID=UPI001BB31544|nr:lipase family protein [Marinomonas sp. A3A]QUX90357.1 lipase [Marinomonas sp. A3A]